MLLNRLALLLAVITLTSPVYAGNNHNRDPDQLAFIDPDLPTISYVNFQSLSPTPLTVSGVLRVPTAATGQKLPAVVIVHGSAGVDSRGKFYAEALNDAGVATLEIDMWAARGWLGGITGRPSSVPSTLPDAYGALQFLSEQPGIDSQRIAIMGFSWGGVVTMLTATNTYNNSPLRFAAHLAHYPVCWVYNNIPGYSFGSATGGRFPIAPLTGAPVLIQTGSLDDYNPPSVCSNLINSLPATEKSLVSLNVYQNDTHGWDRLQPAQSVTDPYSHQGKGGQVQFTPDVNKAKLSRKRAVEFFETAFGIEESTPHHDD